jgi:hypothetical protein
LVFSQLIINQKMHANTPLFARTDNNLTCSKPIVRLPPKILKRPPISNVLESLPKKLKQEVSPVKNEPISVPIISQQDNDLYTYVQTQPSSQPNKEALLVEFALLHKQEKEIQTRLEQVKTQLKIALNDGTHKVPGSETQVRKNLTSKPLKCFRK